MWGRAARWVDCVGPDFFLQPQGRTAAAFVKNVSGTMARPSASERGNHACSVAMEDVLQGEQVLQGSMLPAGARCALVDTRGQLGRSALQGPFRTWL